MIILMGHIDLDPADMDAFAADVRALAPVVRAEPGCLFYSLVPEDAAAGRMLLAQRWQDAAALARHLEAPSTLAFQKKWLHKLQMDVQRHAVNDAGVLAF
jgi:quinol monooxygenase YgiN